MAWPQRLVLSGLAEAANALRHSLKRDRSCDASDLYRCHRARGRSVGRRGAVAGEPTYELKFNTVDVPMQPEYKAMVVFGKNLEALSAAKIKVRTFHSSQRGDHQYPDRRTPRRSK